MSIENISKKSFKNNSDFGIYEVNDSLDLRLPQTKIQIKNSSANKFSYFRESPQNNTLSKYLISEINNFKVEIAPILPIHIPEQKTNVIFLKFDTPLELNKNSTAEFYIKFPMEIGLFSISADNSKGLIDYFSCDPVRSRFGLYGNPDDGVFCKCFPTEISDSTFKPDNFLFAQMRIKIQNETNSNQLLNKVIFASSNLDLYYKKSQVVIDMLNATIKNQTNITICEVSSEDDKKDGFAISPRTIHKTSEAFLMEKGI